MGKKKATHTIVTYALTSLSPAQKVRFVQRMRGRSSQKGLVQELKGEFLADRCCIVPQEHLTRIVQEFEYWKIPFDCRKVILIH